MPRAARKIGDVVAFEEVAYVEPKWNNFEVMQAPPLPVVEDPLPKPLNKDDGKDLDQLGKAVKLFQKPLGTTYPSRWCVGTEKSYREYPAEICHAKFKEIPDDVTFFATNCGIQTEDDKEMGDAWFEFMIGHQSPWRCLFEHGRPGKLFYENGLLSGCTLNIIDLKDVDKKTLVYNFCIAIRMIHEYPGTIRGWYHYVQNGMHPVDALYFCRMYLPVSNTDGMVARSQTNNGCHWPFWFFGSSYYEKDPGYINFDRLYEGRPTFKGRSCSQWTEKVKKREFTDFNSKVQLQKVKKGAFSIVSGYPETEVISEFMAWKQDYQEKLNTTSRKRK